MRSQATCIILYKIHRPLHQQPGSCVTSIFKSIPGRDFLGLSMMLARWLSQGLEGGRSCIHRRRPMPLQTTWELGPEKQDHAKRVLAVAGARDRGEGWQDNPATLKWREAKTTSQLAERVSTFQQLWKSKIRDLLSRKNSAGIFPYRNCMEILPFNVPSLFGITHENEAEDSTSTNGQRG